MVMRIGAIVVLAVAMAVSAQADLINGNFSSPGASGVAGTMGSISVLDTGWVTNNNATQILEISGGAATRLASAANSMAGIGQYFTFTGDGAAELLLDVAMTDADSDLDWWVNLYGWNQLGAQVNLGGSDALAISGMPGSSNAPVGTAYAITALVEAFHINAGAQNATLTYGFTASSNYEFYGIRIVANHPDAGDAISFDNVTVGMVVPEPSTAILGMVGLVVMYRRIRQRA
jgi:hypothetical protein